MNFKTSRRDFLSAGLALPVVGLGSKMGFLQPSDKSTEKAAGSPVTLEHRTLGKTGLKVTTLGFGCMITSDPSVITRAADIGINYFDTARGYQQGNNERMVGAALKRKRKDIVLSTKTEGKDKAEALAQLDTSLKELGTDFLDVWYLHGKDKQAEVSDDLIEAQQIAIQAGKVRFAGVSTHNLDMLPFLTKHEKVSVILANYNFTMVPAWTAAMEAAAKAGKGVVAMKVMAGGKGPGRGGAANPNAERFSQPGAMAAVYRWVTRNPNVHTTIPSMTDIEQVAENIQAGVQPFTAADAKLLAERRELIRPFYCNVCGECEGACRKGLPVANMLRFAMYADGYGQFALGRERFLELSAEHAAVRCADCSSCTVTCPHGVHVVEQLTRAQDIFGC